MAADNLRASARRLKTWCTLLVAGLLVVLVVESAARVGLFGRAPDVQRLGLDALAAVPALLYLAALWRVRQALAAIAGGDLFTPVLARLLRQVGVLLFLGAACAVALAPLLHRLAGDAFPRLIEYDVANFVLGAIGIAFTFLARLFDRAVGLQRELEDIF